MKAQGTSNPSLWWKLSWQLSVVVSAMIAVVIIGLCFYGVMMLSPILRSGTTSRPRLMVHFRSIRKRDWSLQRARHCGP